MLGMEQDPDKQRMDKLADELERLRRAKAASIESEDSARMQKNQVNQGMRVVTELIAGMGGGALIGWLFDRWFDTTPWLMLCLMLLGIIAAFRNIVVKASQSAPPPDKLP
jgi:ATP synthase protein I